MSIIIFIVNVIYLALLLHVYFNMAQSCTVPWYTPSTLHLRSADIDECEEGSDNCVSEEDQGSCTNTEGAFTCGCEEGYTGDGTTNGTGCTGKAAHWKHTELSRCQLLAPEIVVMATMVVSVTTKWSSWRLLVFSVNLLNSQAISWYLLAQYYKYSLSSGFAAQTHRIRYESELPSWSRLYKVVTGSFVHPACLLIISVNIWGPFY